MYTVIKEIFMGRITAKDYDISYVLSRNSFYIPSYQRGYEWKEETAIQLLEDLFSHLEKNSESDYFIGNIITYQIRERSKNQQVLVDGQQRITTLMLMLTALKIAAFTSPTLSSDEIAKVTELVNEYILDDIGKGEKEERIKLFSNIRQSAIEEILSCKVKDKNLAKDNWMTKIRKEYGTTNYYKNLEAFTKVFVKRMESFQDFLDFTDLLKRIIVVVIDIDNDEGVHEIFENINSKGVDLNLSDLTKNFFYILLETKYKIEASKENFSDTSDEKNNLENEISDIFENKIDDLKCENSSFITNYLIFLKKEHFNKENTKEVYKELKDLIKQLIVDGKKTINDLIKEINEQISLIKYIEDFTSNNSSSKYDLGLFLNKDSLSGVIFPFVYAVAKKLGSFEHQQIKTNESFKEFILLMDKFFTRRLMIKSTDKNFNKYTPTLLKGLDKLEELKIEKIEELLTNKGDESDNGSLMPTKQQMLDYFMNNNSPYRTKKSKQLKQILFKVNYFMTINSKEGIALNEKEYSKFTIEHVMPQNPKEDSNWILDAKESFNNLTDELKNSYDNDYKKFYEETIHNWGNLTITQDNSALSNDDFEDKIEIFKSSTLRINQWIASQTQWKLREMEIRRNDLHSIIKKHF